MSPCFPLTPLLRRPRPYATGGPRPRHIRGQVDPREPSKATYHCQRRYLAGRPVPTAPSPTFASQAKETSPSTLPSAYINPGRALRARNRRRPAPQLRRARARRRPPSPPAHCPHDPLHDLPHIPLKLIDLSEEPHPRRSATTTADLLRRLTALAGEPPPTTSSSDPTT